MDNLIKRLEEWLLLHSKHRQPTAEIITALVERVKELSLIHTETGVVNAALILDYKNRAKAAEARVKELENCKEKSGGYCPGCMNSTVDRLTTELAEAKSIINDLSGRHGIQTGSMEDNSCEWRTKYMLLEKQLAEREQIAARKVVERARLEDENADLRRQLAERDAEIAKLQERLNTAGEVWTANREENASLREEVGRLKADLRWAKKEKELVELQLKQTADQVQIERENVKESRKQTAQEIYNSVARMHGYNPARETIMANIKEKYGLEG